MDGVAVEAAHHREEVQAGGQRQPVDDQAVDVEGVGPGRGVHRPDGVHQGAGREDHRQREAGERPAAELGMVAQLGAEHEPADGEVDDDEEEVGDHQRGGMERAPEGRGHADHQAARVERGGGGEGAEPARVAADEAVPAAAGEGLDAQRQPGDPGGQPDDDAVEVEHPAVAALEEDVDAVHEVVRPAGEGHEQPGHAEVGEAVGAPVATHLHRGHHPVAAVGGAEDEVGQRHQAAHRRPRIGTPIWRMNSWTLEGSPRSRAPPWTLWTRAAARADRGSTTVKVEPRPTALRTLTWPPIASTSERTMKRPIPTPPVRGESGARACQNCSKQRATSSPLMPMPKSEMLMRTARRSAAAVTTTSATTVSPSARETLTTAATMASAAGSRPRPVTKERSILTASTGKRRR